MSTLFIVIFVVLGVLLTFYALRPGTRKLEQPLPEQLQRQELEEERDALYKHIIELEHEREQGLIDQHDYERLRLRDETRAAMILERLEDLPPALIKTTSARGRPVWPLAIGILGVIALGGVLANAFVVPPLQLLALRPGEAEYYRQSREIVRLEDQLEAEARLDPQNGPKTETLLAYGELAWQLKDYERAARAYGPILRRDPRNVIAVRRYGIVLFFGGQNKEAKELLNASIRLEPHPEAYMNLGNLLFGEKDAKGAIAAWEKYLELAPPSEAGRIPELIASARKQLGATDPGEKLFTQNCSGCHGANAQGLVGPNLKTSSLARDRARVQEQILQGSQNAQMPSFTQFSPKELQELVSYVTRLK
jgi:cytochrome c-type biogenesis protein CcmH/NrfG